MKRLSWVTLAIGLWLVATATVLPRVNGEARVEDIIAGLTIALGALWAGQAFDIVLTAAAGWTLVCAGAWVAIAPLVLRYHIRRVFLLNDVMVGLAVLMIGATSVWREFQHGV